MINQIFRLTERLAVPHASISHLGGASVRSAISRFARSGMAAALSLVIMTTGAAAATFTLNCSTVGASQSDSLQGGGADTLQVSNLPLSGRIILAFTGVGNPASNSITITPTNGTVATSPVTVGSTGSTASATFTATSAFGSSASTAMALALNNGAGRNVSWTATCADAVVALTTTVNTASVTGTVGVV